MNVRSPVRLSSISDRTVTSIAERVGMAAAARIRIGCLTVVLPDGRRRVFGDPASERRGEIHIHDEDAVVRMLLHGETGAGEAYMDGLWTSPDLEALIELAALNRSALALSTGWWRRPLEVPRRLAHRARRNTKEGARRNISAH